MCRMPANTCSTFARLLAMRWLRLCWHSLTGLPGRISLLEQRRGPVHAQPLAEAPNGVAVRHIHRIPQQAQKGCSGAARPGCASSPRWDGRPATLAAIAAFDSRHQPDQFSEADAPRDHLQRIAHRIALVLARGIGEQIELQGAEGRIKGWDWRSGGTRDLLGFERSPHSDPSIIHPGSHEASWIGMGKAHTGAMARLLRGCATPQTARSADAHGAVIRAEVP